MNKTELNKALKLLDEHCERVEWCYFNADFKRQSYCVTAHWYSGGQCLFHNFQHVVDAVENRCSCFRFATDSESGVIYARTFIDAQDKLRKMLPKRALLDGAWGWVEDKDGGRFEIESITVN